MLLFWTLIIGTAGLLLGLNGCGGSSSPASDGGGGGGGGSTQKIQHVVIIFQENRTPDNLFQGLCIPPYGSSSACGTGSTQYDISSTGLTSAGQKIPLTAMSLATDYDLSHAHSAWVSMYDGGKMDGADQIPIDCIHKGEADCPSPTAWFRYVNPSQVAPYLQMAKTYTFGDRMFQTNQGPSFPAHQFIISGTSAPVPPGETNSNYFAAENMTYPANHGTNTNAGCVALPGTTAAWIDANGPTTVEINVSPAQYPCYEHPTLTDLLDAKAVSWRYYSSGPGSIWVGPNAIQHICVPDGNGNCTGSVWTKNVAVNQNQILTDISSGQLQSVSWVTPDGQESDHAGVNDGSGPSWVSSIVNAIGNSPYWSNTAIILTWDDWGGWYDHVPPPAILNSYEFGFRVPLVVISPYAKPGYISHTVYDFGSILKFVEATFSLPTVAPGATPAYADTFTQTGDLSDCFDFTQTPLTFQTVPAALDASHFLNDKSAPLDPDDD
jgi:phospholipase C